MRAKLLMMFVAIVLIASACQIKREMLTLDIPSITIKEVNVINSDKGKVICYTINLYSPSSLSEFVAIPNIATDEEDEITTFKFDNHTRRATVYYFLPVSEMVNPDEVSIRFLLNNSTTEVSNMALFCSL